MSECSVCTDYEKFLHSLQLIFEKNSTHTLKANTQITLLFLVGQDSTGMIDELFSQKLLHEQVPHLTAHLPTYLH